MFKLIFVLVTISLELYAEKIRYISMEHPAVTYYNTKYVSYANLTSRRYGRADPFHYVGLNLRSISTIGNNVTVHFYFDESMSYRFRQSFLEMQFRFCDLIDKDQFFGSALRERLVGTCPFGPGEYNLYNMTVPLQNLPRNFPFSKGRIHCNFKGSTTNELLGTGHIDMEIKEFRKKKI